MYAIPATPPLVCGQNRLEEALPVFVSEASVHRSPVIQLLFLRGSHSVTRTASPPYLLKPWGDEGPGSPSNGSIQTADLLHTSLKEKTVVGRDDQPHHTHPRFLYQGATFSASPKRNPCAAIRPSGLVSARVQCVGNTDIGVAVATGGCTTSSVPRDAPLTIGSPQWAPCPMGQGPRVFFPKGSELCLGTGSGKRRERQRSGFSPSLWSRYPGACTRDAASCSISGVSRHCPDTHEAKTGLSRCQCDTRRTVKESA